MFDMLRERGVAEDQALQLSAHYRRPYPGFYEPDDLPYAEDGAVTEAAATTAVGQTADARADQSGSLDPAPATAPDTGA